MGAKSSIEWTDATWTPIRARVRPNAAAIATAKGYTSLIKIGHDMAYHVGPHCEMVGPECIHCYSQTNNSRCLPANGTGLPFDRRARDLVEPFLDLRILEQPTRWRKPRKVFVCSQTDLFGQWVPTQLIDNVLSRIAFASWHTFQVLTKRAERMERYFSAFKPNDQGFITRDGVPIEGYDGFVGNPDNWPLRNLWLGVSAGNQDAAEERIEHLLQTPAVLHMVSLEPLLGPINLDRWIMHLDWVIVGGESGRGARPMHPDWARSLRDQCASAYVPFMFKQWGEWAPIDKLEDPHYTRALKGHLECTVVPADPPGIPGTPVYRVGKKAAGRLLDGREHNDIPEVQS